MNRILAAALRISGTQMSQASIERQLGCAVERFSETYAQIDVPLGKGEEWATIDAFLIKLGSIIRQMQEESIIQSADLDVAFGVAEDWVGISRTVPARTAALAAWTALA